MNKNKRILGSILLITGTSIGAGMLGLPVVTGLNGFIPSMSSFAICCIITLWSAFIMLDIINVFKNSSNLITMTKHTLGISGATITGFTFLGLFYALLAAYITASGNLFVEINKHCINSQSFIHFAPFIIIFICFPLLMCKIKYIDMFNKCAFIVLMIAYFFLVGLLSYDIKSEYLIMYRGGFFLNSISMTILSFAFHPILPTISNYLFYNIRSLIYIVFMGTLIPLVIYICWEMVLLGVIPISGDLSISVAHNKGVSFSFLLMPILNNYLVTASMWTFSLFAIFTSFLSVSLASVDFFMDAFNFEKNIHNKIKSICLTYVPPIYFAYNYQRGFYMILEYAGVFLIILIGVLPIFMIYTLRYKIGTLLKFKFLNNVYILFTGLIIYIVLIIFIFIKNLGFIEIIT
jgi:tyrosine-specific transport protein